MIVVIATLVSQIAKLLASFLPLKVVALLGSNSIPAYFPSWFAIFEREVLIIGLSAATVCFYLLYHLAEYLIRLGAESGASQILAQNQKMVLFDNQDEVAVKGYQQYSKALASAVFVALALTTVSLLYAKVALLIFVYVAVVAGGTVLVIKGNPHLRERLSAKVNSSLTVASSVGFLTTFVFLLADFLLWNPPSLMVAVGSVMLVRQTFTGVRGVIISVVALNRQRSKLDALYFHGRVFLGDDKRHTHRGIWEFASHESRAEWIQDVLADVAGHRPGKIRTRWYQTGFPDVLAFKVYSGSDSPDYLVKLFDKRRTSLALHEETLLNEINYPELPTLRFLGPARVESYSCHVFEWRPLVPCEAVRTASLEMMARLLATEVPDRLERRYGRSRPFVWQRFDATLIERLRLAASDRTEQEQVMQLESELGAIGELLSNLPLWIVNRDARSESLLLDQGGGPVLTHWGRWTLEPVGAGWFVQEDQLSQIADALEHAQRIRPSLQGLTSSQLELAALSYDLERLYLAQNYGSALDLVPRILAVWDKIRTKGSSQISTGTARAQDSNETTSFRELIVPKDRTRIRIPQCRLPDGPIVRSDLKVAGIMDEFTWSALRYEFAIQSPLPTSWRDAVAANPPDLLFVESAWRGNRGTWRNLIGGPNGPSQQLRDLVSWCRQRGIPTVFWNKEDPPNFNWFIQDAALFDHVFTVDANSVDRYRSILGYDRIHVFPFAAQPRIHNPILAPGGRVYDVAFAGTYYTKKHPNRKKQMEVILEPARQFNLHIYDRTVVTPQNRWAYRYPRKFQGHIVGGLPYEEMVAAYKRYKVFLNVNSVVDSPTMCARRVYELLACGTSVLSGFSPAIDHSFGEDLVCFGRNKIETTQWLTRLLEDEEQRQRRAVAGVRTVLTEHTYGRRIDHMLQLLGFPCKTTQPLVSVLAFARDLTEVEAIARSVERQRYGSCELILCLTTDEIDPSVARERSIRIGLVPTAVITQGPSSTFADVQRSALRSVRGEYVTLMHPGHYYGADFLTDMLAAFQYTSAHIITKATHYAFSHEGEVVPFASGQEHQYASDVAPYAFVADWPSTSGILHACDLTQGFGPNLTKAAKLSGLSMYSIDKYNYVSTKATAGSPVGEKAVRSVEDIEESKYLKAAVA